jgi:hypothetical protein
MHDDLQVQRELIPLNAMTDNPHYDSQTAAEADGKEMDDQSVGQFKPEYNILSSSMLRSIGELGEGVRLNHLKSSHPVKI